MYTKKINVYNELYNYSWLHNYLLYYYLLSYYLLSPHYFYLCTGVRVNSANVIQADMMATNGVVHVIDQLLIPQDLNQIAGRKWCGFLITINLQFDIIIEEVPPCMKTSYFIVFLLYCCLYKYKCKEYGQFLFLK